GRGGEGGVGDRMEQLALEPQELRLVEAGEERLAEREALLDDTEGVRELSGSTKRGGLVREVVAVATAETHRQVEVEPLLDLGDGFVHRTAFDESRAPPAEPAGEPRVDALLRRERDHALRRLERALH